MFALAFGLGHIFICSKNIFLTEIQNARGIMDVLAEMLSAIDPTNKEAIRQEVIVDLVDQCRTYKQRVVHLVNSTSLFLKKVLGCLHQVYIRDYCFS
ncbi:hypothetical protein vseg_020990 [Gypsophila vaccaria]